MGLAEVLSGRMGSNNAIGRLSTSYTSSFLPGEAASACRVRVLNFGLDIPA
jgi:hypothetical protein